MPFIFRYQSIRFHFFSNGGSPGEPLHIHAGSHDADAKFWLVPEVLVASNTGFDRRTLAELRKVVETHHDVIERAWNEHFS